MTRRDQEVLEEHGRRFAAAGLGAHVIAIFDGAGMIVSRATWDKHYESNPAYIHVKEVP